MFQMTSFHRAPLAGTLLFRGKDPRHSGLGTYTDIDGRRWHIKAILGRYVCACPVNELHPYYSDTSDYVYGYVEQTWKPYDVVVQEDAA